MNLLFLRNFLLAYSCFTMCSFLLFFGFLSQLDHHRAQSSLRYIVGSHLCLVYTEQCLCVNPNLSIHPNPCSPWCPHVCSLHLCLCFCFANKITFEALRPAPAPLPSSPPTFSGVKYTYIYIYVKFWLCQSIN